MFSVFLRSGQYSGTGLYNGGSSCTGAPYGDSRESSFNRNKHLIIF